MYGYDAGHFAERPERWRPPAERLIDFLRLQFKVVHGIDVSASGLEDSQKQGKFFKFVGAAEDHWLTRGTEKIVMKLPHPLDSRHDYYEIFALLPPYVVDETHLDAPGAEANSFLVRRYIAGEGQGFELVDSSGAGSIEADPREVDRVLRAQDASGASTGLDAEQLTAILGDPFKRQDRAEALLGELSECSPVAIF